MDYERILLTGAAGRLGSVLRKSLAPLARNLRLADASPISTQFGQEEIVTFDLADMKATLAACEGCDAIVHFGAVAMESSWQTILDSNIRGTYHIFEGARMHGARRVIYASSVHAVGYYKIEDQIGLDAPVRPDSLYGVSKTFGESLSRLYWDKFGLESVCLRMFSSFSKPRNRRMLWSYLSFEDCARLTEAALTAPRVGHTISYGLSDNKTKVVDNSGANHLGYTARDTAEPWREELEANTPVPDPRAPADKHLGGWFCDIGHPDDPD
ncbi:MAG: NAD(P)-dependent oxidoreductase [Rhodobacteraceae bacterium]|nr:NAD(P)-dependent oxidoreductase [Paracoccaceae bacterium]